MPYQFDIPLPPMKVKGTPEQGSGTTLPSMPQLFDMLADPAMREAIDLVERVQGGETALRRQVRKQLVHDRVAWMHAQEQARAIDLAIKKANDPMMKVPT